MGNRSQTFSRLNVSVLCMSVCRVIEGSVNLVWQGKLE
jgi:hypothetical protein